RPPVWPSRNCPELIARNAPPSPAIAPEMITAAYLWVSTFTPSDSAAYGASPQDRTRSPNGVRHSTEKVSPNSTTAMIDSSETWVVNPRMNAARSETKNQCLRSTSSSHEDSPGTDRCCTSWIGGDCFCPPPGAWLNLSLARNRATPGAIRLIATPEMMWSTP